MATRTDAHGSTLQMTMMAIAYNVRVPRLIMAAAVLLAMIAGWSDGTDAREGLIDFRNKSLVEIIQSYQSSGYGIVYSTDLVTDDLIVKTQPGASEPIEQLKEALRPFELTLKVLDDETWLVTPQLIAKTLVLGRVTTRFNLPIAEVRVSVGDARQLTDADGRFSLSLDPGKYVFSTSVSDFHNTASLVRIEARETQVVTLALESNTRIESIVVTASRYELSHDITAGTRYLLTARQIENTPTLGDDAIRAVITLPGAANIGYSSKPRVRGGYADEVLVILDGVELIEPFHLKDFQSLFSTLNPGTIRSIDYYTGGFPARYGNRMSAVLDIATQGVSVPLGGELSLTTFTTSAIGYGSTDNGDWLVAVRRGNLDVITDIVNPEVGKPSYYDALLRYGHDFASGARLEFSVLNYTDDVELSVDDSTTFSHISNNYQWLKWEDEWRPDLILTTIFSVGNIRHNRSGIADDEDKVNGEIRDERDFTVVSLKQLFDWKLNEDWLLEGGLYLTNNDADYDYQAMAVRGEIAGFLGNEEELDYAVTESRNGLSAGVYLSARIAINDYLTIQPGIRYDLQDYLAGSSEQQLAFRLGLLYEFTDEARFRLSLGRFYQPQAIHELQITDAQQRFFKPQQSEHLILSYEYVFSSDIALKTEVFYKSFDAIKPRFENLFNPFVAIPEIAPDRIRIDARSAYAKGLEVSLASNEDQPLYWWLNLSVSKVEDLVENHWIPRRWDQRRTVNAGANWRFGNWNASAAGTWHSGWATTRLPRSLNADDVISIPDLRNGDRLRAYSTLDIRLSYEKSLANSSLIFFTEIVNIFNRTNDGGTDYEVVEEDGELLFLEREVESVFPLSTSVGIMWRF